LNNNDDVIKENTVQGVMASKPSTVMLEAAVLPAAASLLWLSLNLHCPQSKAGANFGAFL
jgi:hypothetical protein